MSRASEGDVRKVIETDPDADLSIYIRTASNLVDYVKSKDVERVLSNAMLREIETYLAGHFYNCRDPSYQAKQTDGASATFHNRSAMLLEGSPQGQSAMILDITGTLSKLNDEAKKGGKRRLTMKWLGKPPSTQIPYDNRD